MGAFIAISVLVLWLFAGYVAGAILCGEVLEDINRMKTGNRFDEVDMAYLEYTAITSSFFMVFGLAALLLSLIGGINKPAWNWPSYIGEP